MNGLFDNLLMAYFGTKEFSGEPEPDYREYFWMQAIDTGAPTSALFLLKGNTTLSITLEYSTDKVNWSSVQVSNNTSFSVANNAKVYLRASTPQWAENGVKYITIRPVVNVKMGGNIMSLLYGSSFNGQREFPEQSRRNFIGLFSSEGQLDDGIKDISEVILPATTLTEFCYSGMFKECRHITRTPSLPASTIASGCYSGMFYNCTALTTAPALPARTLAEACYSEMFYGCTSLSTPPSLPATTLARHCYASMFQGCTNIVTAPALPVMTLADYCYQLMFYGCTSLTTAPALPATTLTASCYYMMFQYCSSLTTAPELPASTLTNGCYEQMFFGCTSLNYIKCLAETFGVSTSGWVYNVSPTGTFVKSANATWATGDSGIPSGWTVQNA